MTSFCWRSRRTAGTGRVARGEGSAGPRVARSLAAAPASAEEAAEQPLIPKGSSLSAK